MKERKKKPTFRSFGNFSWGSPEGLGEPMLVERVDWIGVPKREANILLFWQSLLLVLLLLVAAAEGKAPPAGPEGAGTVAVAALQGGAAERGGAAQGGEVGGGGTGPKSWCRTPVAAPIALSEQGALTPTELLLAV